MGSAARQAKIMSRRGQETGRWGEENRRTGGKARGFVKKEKPNSREEETNACHGTGVLGTQKNKKKQMRFRSR